MSDQHKADRFMVLMQAIQAVPVEDRQKMVDVGKRDRSPKVRLFFECLERELRAMGHLPGARHAGPAGKRWRPL